MPAVSMNHFTVLTDDLSRTTEFYREILGLTEGYRPDLGMPGAWLYAGGTAVLHVIGGRQLPDVRNGVIDHMAFSGVDLRDVVGRLERHGVEYTLRRQPETDIWQMFFKDPNGARVELDFPAHEALEGETPPPARPNES